MSISQHVISWIQIGGLVVSLYGFFFLTTIYGDRGISRFRPLLPATGSIFATLLIFQICYQIAKQLITTNTNYSMNGVDYLYNIMELFSVIALAGYTYNRAFRLQKQRDSNQQDYEEINVSWRTLWRTLKILILNIISTILAISFVVIPAYRFILSSIPSGFRNLSLEALLIVVSIFFSFSISLDMNKVISKAVNFLPESSLRNIGFIFSILGILTSFLPAVVDVIGIPVR